MEMQLTPREEEVYKELVTNSGNLTDIGKKLNLSSATIRTYMQNISYKLGISGRADLIIRHYQKLLARAEGITE